MKQIKTHSLSVISALKEGFIICMSHAKEVIPFALISLVMGLILLGYMHVMGGPALFNQNIENDPMASISYFILIAIFMFVQIMLISSLLLKSNAVLKNKAAPWLEYIKEASNRFIPLIWGGFLFYLILVLISLMIIIPTFILMGRDDFINISSAASLMEMLPIMAAWFVVLAIACRWALFPMAVLIDNKSGYQAIKYSHQLNKSWQLALKTFGVIVVTWVLLPLIGMPISMLMDLFVENTSFTGVVAHTLLYSLDIIVHFYLLFWGIASLVCWYKKLQTYT